MDYSFLQPGEQLSMLRPRLQEAERRHYDLTLSDETQGGLNYAKQKQEIEANIAYLQGEIKRVEALAK